MTERELAKALGIKGRFFNNTTILHPRLVEKVISLRRKRKIVAIDLDSIDSQVDPPTNVEVSSLEPIKDSMQIVELALKEESKLPDWKVIKNQQTKESNSKKSSKKALKLNEDEDFEAA